MKKLLLHISILFTTVCSGQLTINAPIHLLGGAQLTVVDLNVSSTADITGTGALLLKNSNPMNLNFNGNSVPTLLVNCTSTANVNMLSDVRINDALSFATGKVNAGNSNIILADNAIITGASSSNYVITGGLGGIVKNITADITNYSLPVGSSINYEPIRFTTAGTYAAGANVTSRLVNAIHPNKPVQNTDYLNNYWALTRTGITGTVTANATYSDPANIVGDESNVKAAIYTAAGWENTGATNNTFANVNGASLTASSGDLFGMNSYVQLNAKAFLQGAYNNATSKMNDNLRTPTNLIPLSDPYRVAPYATVFVHVNNALVETAANTVFTNQANADNNIVDWVFVELRNSAIGAPGSNKVKTRAALIQRDGDIVDVDGVSPLFLRDISPGQYTVVVRHRNHLGLSTDPINNLQTLDMKTPSAITDFTTFTDAELFGKADSNYKVQSTKNLLYAGNANFNNRISFSGLNSDKDRIFSALSNQPNNLTINNVYSASDVNMNRNVRYVNLNNDKDFLFGILGSSISNIKNQSLP
jgi:hypothetical protein